VKVGHQIEEPLILYIAPEAPAFREVKSDEKGTRLPQQWRGGSSQAKAASIRFGWINWLRREWNSAREAPNSKRRMASSLNSFVNFRRDNPMAQFLHLKKNEP
jgi:hypothetical protein